MESPCILVCSIDDVTGLCFGCGRTQAEIGAWTLYSGTERRDIMATLAARLARVEKKPRRQTKRGLMGREKK